MIAYKFLAPGAEAPFTGFRWPVGEWVEARGPLDPCRNGVHACRPGDLASWIDEELWTIELAGRSLSIDGLVVAERGRLQARVGGWNPETGREFARACAERARARAGGRDVRGGGYADDAETFAATAKRAKDVATAAFVAAHAAGLAEPGGYAAERAWQAAWLADRLALGE